ncbi:MAG: DUF389 domain-containing protein [Bryobacterales bacterium]|nr:DUF389 domain-containing protein [Bryobacterales bacterium]
MTPAGSVRETIEHLLRVDPSAKPKIYGAVLESSEIFSLNYWLELSLSAGIATLGLVQDSPAVVIGAMLISPLMGPILAAGLALAAADLYLGLKSLLNLIVSILGALAISAAIVSILPFHAATSEILARTRPNLLDLGIALFSGFAGALIVVRGGSGGGVTALPGVAVAVALMPPLCTMGFGVGAGWQGPIIGGAGLLFFTNLAAIIASAFVVFWILRMDSRDVREEIDRLVLERAHHDVLYQVFQATGLSGSFGIIGKLRWRIAMLLVALGLVFVPLTKALFQLRQEVQARTAVRNIVRQLIPADEVVFQEPLIRPDLVRVRLVVTGEVETARIREAETELARLAGRKAEINVRRVTGDDELRTLREALLKPVGPPPREDLDSLRVEIRGRVEGPLFEVWPHRSASLKQFFVRLASDLMILRVDYEADQDLDEAVRETVLRSVQTRLGVSDLTVELINVKPAEVPAAKPGARRRD